MKAAMKTRCRLNPRANRKRAFYCVYVDTGKRTSLQTSDEAAARQVIEGKKISVRQPATNLLIPQVYLQHNNSALAGRTWQCVMLRIARVADTNSRA
jgi:hypothetical protein